MISHGVIEVSGQGNTFAPSTQGHGVLAWTDTTTDVAILLQGSNTDVDERSILFASRNRVVVAGSVDNTLCIQVIGQGRNQISGIGSKLGPLIPGCEPEVTPMPTPTNTQARPTATPTKTVIVIPPATGTGGMTGTGRGAPLAENHLP
jgi:hypothetical protein